MNKKEKITFLNKAVDHWNKALELAPTNKWIIHISHNVDMVKERHPGQILNNIKVCIWNLQGENVIENIFIMDKKLVIKITPG